MLRNTATNKRRSMKSTELSRNYELRSSKNWRQLLFSSNPLFVFLPAAVRRGFAALFHLRADFLPLERTFPSSRPAEIPELVLFLRDGPKAGAYFPDSVPEPSV